MSKEMLRVSSIVLALFLAFGGTALAQSDPHADAVDNGATSINDVSCGGDCAGAPGDALGAPDNIYVSLGDAGWVTLDFTNNTCLVDPFDDDVTVHEFTGGVPETFNARVGQQGAGLVATVFPGTGTDDLNVASTGLAAFNRIRIADAGDDITTGGTWGYDLDAVTCLNNLAFGMDHITKSNEGDDTIEVGVNFQQGPYVFEISITNSDNEDLTGIWLIDNVPAEFDITDELLVTSDSPDCPVELLGEVTKTKGSPNKNQKLAPDFVRIGPLDDLGDGESCTITVGGIFTDGDHPGRGRNPTYTPTSCLDGSITLNEGVKVYKDVDSDGDLDLLFMDDDSLELECVFPD